MPDGERLPVVALSGLELLGQGCAFVGEAAADLLEAGDLLVSTRIDEPRPPIWIAGSRPSSIQRRSVRVL